MPIYMKLVDQKGEQEGFTFQDNAHDFIFRFNELRPTVGSLRGVIIDWGDGHNRGAVGSGGLTAVNGGHVAVGGAGGHAEEAAGILPYIMQYLRPYMAPGGRIFLLGNLHLATPQLNNLTELAGAQVQFTGGVYQGALLGNLLGNFTGGI